MAASLPDYLEFAVDLAQRAGARIRPHFREAIRVEDKGDTAGYDPVTIADRDAEALIRERIRRKYPRHGIRGEEHGSRKGSSKWTWVVDPIDGTRSFIVGQLHWATLIALHDGKRPVVGVAHQPYVGETFLAIAGERAQWRSGTARRALATRRCRRIGDAVVACTDPLMFRTRAERAAFDRVSKPARLTRWGGDCYAYCLLAMGFIDIVIESSLKAHDIQALIPIVEGAGGVITQWRGGPADEGGSVVACGDPQLHDAVLRLLAGRSKLR